MRLTDELTVNDITSYVNRQMEDIAVCTVAKITGVNGNSINCKPIGKKKTKTDKIELPEFKNVPYITLQGGGSYISMPIKVGDYCILFVNDRPNDAWLFESEIEQEDRTHDYSDSIALVGVNPLSESIPIIDMIKIVGNTQHIGNNEQEGDFIIKGDIKVNGNISAKHIICDKLTVGGIDFKTHKHTGVSRGYGITDEAV